MPLLAFGLSWTPVSAAIVNGSFDANTSTVSDKPKGSEEITGWITTLSGVEYFRYFEFDQTAREDDWSVDLSYFSSRESGGSSRRSSPRPISSLGSTSRSAPGSLRGVPAQRRSF